MAVPRPTQGLCVFLQVDAESGLHVPLQMNLQPLCSSSENPELPLWSEACASGAVREQPWLTWTPSPFPRDSCLPHSLAAPAALAF